MNGGSGRSPAEAVNDLDAAVLGSQGGSVPDAELRDVTKRYPGGVLAVAGVSLAIARGEFFSLLGPSGCGKSTTLRLIAGLETATSGDILIRGELMGDRPANHRPTNMVFQQLALFPHLDVFGNVAFGLRLRRTPNTEIRKRVEEALELVQLGGFQRRMPRQLSGGQQQRIAIARALVNNPAVLLLDEPLGALDLRLRLQLQEALKQIQRTSETTFIYVTHDQTEALTMSDRIGIMHDGRLEQVDTPSAIYERPATRFAATFVGETNLLEGTYHGGHLDTGDLQCHLVRPGPAVSVRPELVQIGSQLDSGVLNRYEGRVEEVVFLGPMVRYRVRLNGGRLVVVERQNLGAVASAQPKSPMEVGSRVEVGWPVEAGVVLED